jgi:hypothetical protein
MAFLLAGQCITAGYIAALEERINIVAGENLAAWESSVTLVTFVGKRSPYLWSEIMMAIVAGGGLLVLLLALVVQQADFVGIRFYTILVVLEIGAGVALCLLGYKAKTWACECARTKFQSKQP